MANGYDGFNVAMGLMADTFDEDEAKRKEARDEQTAIRREDRADTRLKAQESRDDTRLIEREKRGWDNDRSVLLDKRNYDEQLAKTNLEASRLMVVKDKLAERGLPHSGVVDVRVGLEMVARHDANKPAIEWFTLNKQYIDRLTEENPEAMYQLNITGPLDLESLSQMQEVDLKALMARLESPVENSRTTQANNRIRNSAGYKKAKKMHDLRMKKLADLAMPVLGNGISINTPESKAAHLEVAALMRNNPEFVELMGGNTDEGNARMDLWQSNPTQFLSSVFNRSKGLDYLTETQGNQLTQMWLQAKGDALLTLEERANSSSNSIADRQKSKAALDFLQKELDYGDTRSIREQLVKFMPELIEQTKYFYDHPVYGKIAKEEGAMLIDFMSNAQPVTNPAVGGQGTGQPGLPGLPGQPAATTAQPAALGGRPGLPAKKAVPTAGQSVEVKGGLPSAARLDLARKVLGEGYGGRFGTRYDSPTGFGNINPFDHPTLTPDLMVTEATNKLLGERRKAEMKLERLGVSKDAKTGKVTALPYDRRYTSDFGSFKEGPYIDDPKTDEQLRSDTSAGIEELNKINIINEQLKVLQDQAERQTNIKVPSLGSGSRQ